jgi:hypothetical protein
MTGVRGSGPPANRSISRGYQRGLIKPKDLPETRDDRTGWPDRFVRTRVHWRLFVGGERLLLSTQPRIGAVVLGDGPDLQDRRRFYRGQSFGQWREVDPSTGDVPTRFPSRRSTLGLAIDAVSFYRLLK